jgi:uncharacterized RDD family membrane protein YckC
MRSPPARYGGIATRTVAFALDLMLAHAIVVVGAGVLGLLTSLLGDLGPDRLVDSLAGAAWALTVGLYFVSFWTVTGQTPGMRLFQLRVVRRDGAPPGLGRAVVRFLGLVLAIAALFVGLVPILFDARRRGAHDFLAGTFVAYDDRIRLLAEEEAETPPARAAVAQGDR